MTKNGSVSRKVNAVRSRPGQRGDTTLKPTVAGDGGSRVTERSRWWKRQRDAAITWERTFRVERQGLLQGGLLAAHTQTYCTNLENILHRIKFGVERWIHRLWQRLRQQFCTSSTRKMSAAMKKVMTENESSGLYQLISFNTSKIYTGLCNERPMSERFVEHLTAIKASVPPDEKYRGMKQLGGAAGWYMIPVAIAEGVVPSAELRRLEAVMIRSEPNSWNNFRKQSKKHEQSPAIKRGRKRLRS